MTKLNVGWERQFLILALLLTSLFAIQLIPPFQSPDEFDHIKRAYALSQGRFFMITPEESSTGTYIDDGLNSYMGIYNKLPFKYDSKISTEDLIKAKQIKWSGVEHFNPAPGVNYYFPLIYLPQATGLFIGKTLGLSVSASYYLARYFCLTVILLMLIYAVRQFPINYAAFGFLLIPMTIFQLASASMDGISTGLAIVALSVFSRMASDNGFAENTKINFYVMLVCLTILIMCRFNLVLMILLPFYLGYKYKNKNFLIGACISLCLILVWLAHGMSTTVDLRVSLGVSTADIILKYITHPFELIGTFWRTVTNQDKIVYYWSSLIGILGWLDHKISMHALISIGFILLALLLLSVDFRKIKQAIFYRGLLILISIGSIVLTFLILLVTWNGYPVNMIEGVQGRYFLIPILTFTFAVAAANLSSNRNVLIFVLCLSLSFITVIAMSSTLLTRYYISNSEIKIAEMAVDDNSSGACALDEPANNSIVNRHQEIIMKGWGFDNESKSIPEKVIIKLIDPESGVSISIPAARTSERPDVAKAFNNENLVASGFASIKIKAGTISAGIYKVKIYQQHGPQIIACPLMNTLEFVN